MTDEKRLYSAIRSGKRDEPKATFQYLYTKYKPLVCFITARYLKEKADIEDVVQETFVRFFNHAGDVRTSVRSYLTVCAKNLALDMRKKNGKVVPMDEEGFPSEMPEDIDRNGGFEALIFDMKRVLSEEDIRIILLHLIEDLRFGDIAVKLEQNERTVKTKYYRALKKYRNARGGKQ